MNRDTMCKHGKIYTCKRIRMLNYLRSKGFVPYDTVVEFNNPRYLNWNFHNSPELENTIYEYFTILDNK